MIDEGAVAPRSDELLIICGFITCRVYGGVLVGRAGMIGFVFMTEDRA